MVTQGESGAGERCVEKETEKTHRTGTQHAAWGHVSLKISRTERCPQRPPGRARGVGGSRSEVLILSSHLGVQEREVGASQGALQPGSPETKEHCSQGALKPGSTAAREDWTWFPFVT